MIQVKWFTLIIFLSIPILFLILISSPVKTEEKLQFTDQIILPNFLKRDHYSYDNISIRDYIGPIENRMNYFFGRVLDLSGGELCFNYSINKSMFFFNESSFNGEILINGDISNLNLGQKRCYNLSINNQNNIFIRINFEHDLPPSDLYSFNLTKYLDGERLSISYTRQDIFLKLVVISILWWGILLIILGSVKYIIKT